MSTTKTAMDCLLERLSAGRWLIEHSERHAAPPAILKEMRRFLTIIGTSGSHDYLKDETDNRRFWDLEATPPLPTVVKTTRSVRKTKSVKTRT